MVKKVDLRNYNNDWYQSSIGAGSIKRAIWFFINMAFFQSYLLPIGSVKVKFLRLFGARVGRGVIIKPGVNIKYPWLLTIGDDCWIGEGVWIDNLATVVIGNNVCLSQGAYLLTGNHDFSKVGFDLIVRSITLEDGVWIGAKAIVCPGVTAHSHAVLTAGSVVSGQMEAYKIYRGNPATIIKQRVIE